MTLNVLVACEESQAVCKAFRELGHRAFSCDLQECSGGHPEWHIQGDALKLINGNCEFITSDTHTHTKRSLGSSRRTPTMHIYIKRWSEISVSERHTERRPTAEGNRSYTLVHGILFC